MKKLKTLLAQATYFETRQHAIHCHECFYPIVDEEGNPGDFKEACPQGVDLLATYCRAIHYIVPQWVMP